MVIPRLGAWIVKRCKLAGLCVITCDVYTLEDIAIKTGVGQIVQVRGAIVF